MKHETHTCIAYIVGRLIAGKSVTSIYDYNELIQIDVSGLPDDRCLKSFPSVNWSFMTGSNMICRYQFSCNAGHHIELAVKGNTFIGYVRDSSTHFIGKVRGDSVYLYDQKASAHFNFRISGQPMGH